MNDNLAMVILAFLLLFMFMFLVYRVSRKTQSKLDQIHTLVNSNLTESQSRELASMKGMLASMREVISLKELSGIALAEGTDEAVELVEQRVSELSRNLSHKQNQTFIADARARRD